MAARFSERTRWEGRRNRWAVAREEAAARGGLLDLTVSDPTACSIDYPAEEILSALADPRTLRYEPLPFGLPEARAAVAAEYARDGIALDPERLLLTASTSESYSFLFKLLADPADSVLTPRPGYPLFDYLAGLESIRTLPYTLDEDGWSPDPEEMAAAADGATRAAILVSPGNPTGSFLHHGAWSRLQEVARSRRWAIISDEVFAAYGLDGPAGGAAERVVCAAAAAEEVLTFSLGGLSKSCGLPQCKVGWIAVGGPPAEAAGALARLEVIADTYLSVSAPVQHALPRLLRAGRAVRDRIRARVAANRAFLEERTDGSPCRLLPAEGGWYAVLEVPRTRSGEDWAVALLRQDRVAVHPGYFYDFPREAYLVLSLLPPEAELREAAERLVTRVTTEAG